MDGSERAHERRCADQSRRNTTKKKPVRKKNKNAQASRQFVHVLFSHSRSYIVAVVLCLRQYNMHFNNWCSCAVCAVGWMDGDVRARVCVSVAFGHIPFSAFRWQSQTHAPNAASWRARTSRARVWVLCIIIMPPLPMPMLIFTIIVSVGRTARICI